MMCSEKKKKSKLRITLTVLILIALLTGMLLLNMHRQFGASLISGYGENKYGDSIELEYDGAQYASLDVLGRYSLFAVDEELTRIRTYSYLKSVLHNYKVYSVEDDPEHIFLWCDSGISTFSDFPSLYYRTDYVFPELKSDNIEEIKVHDDELNVLCTLEDKEMIKYFFGESTKIKHEDVISYTEELNVKSTTANKDIYVTAKFKNSPLHYELGLLDETEREYYEYGERDKTNDDEYMYYDIFG